MVTPITIVVVELDTAHLSEIRYRTLANPRPLSNLVRVARRWVPQN